MTAYQIILFFIIYSIIGWVVEVVYHVVKHGSVVNRGYLNGPVCPIYGFGMIAVIMCLGAYQNNNYMIFIGGMVLATVIEFIGGYALYHFFHQRWWDYTKEPFNVGGYICPRFAILWGIGAVIVMNMIHPIVNKLVSIFPAFFGWIMIVVLSITYAIDMCATTVAVLHMKKEFERLESIGHSMREISDELTQRIGNKTIEIEQQIDESRVQFALGHAELENRLKELKESHNEIIARLHSNKIYGSGRILEAFPALKRIYRKVEEE